MTKLKVCYATPDEKLFEVFAYLDDNGSGSIRDANHVTEIVEHLTRTGGHAEKPPAGWREAFVIELGVMDTRRGNSAYVNWDFRQVQPCPHEVAEEGMNIYREIKRVLRRAKNEQGGKYGVRKLA